MDNHSFVLSQHMCKHAALDGCHSYNKLGSSCQVLPVFAYIKLGWSKTNIKIRTTTIASKVKESLTNFSGLTVVIVLQILLI